jgi:hypothetical protein
MKITNKHYYCFGEMAKQIGNSLISAKSWDAIRTENNDEDSPFSIPKERDLWIKKCKKNEIIEKRSEAVSSFLRKQNFKKINSFGVGVGILECNLKRKNPNIVLNCYDYTPATIKRLKEIFVEADGVEVFDILNDKWFNDGKEALFLLHRIDTDFNDKQWKLIFAKMNLAGIEDILFIPCDVSTIKSLIREKISYFYQKFIKKSDMSFVGYLRTRDQFITLFNKYYKLEEELKINDLSGFYLKLKKI